MIGEPIGVAGRAVRALERRVAVENGEPPVATQREAYGQALAGVDRRDAGGRRGRFEAAEVVGQERGADQDGVVVGGAVGMRGEQRLDVAAPT